MINYVAPIIVRHGPGGVNPHANGARRVVDAIDGVPVTALLERHGSPVFVFSEGRLRAACRRVRAAFAAHYDDVQLAWSYKTNYLRAICRVFHQEGSWAEVVSDFEYEKARNLGIPGARIVFNGPNKSIAALERAVDEEALIQVDHFEELAALEAIAKQHSGPVRVALRISLDAGIRPVWSKFGFCLENGEAMRAVRTIAGSRGGLQLIGLHCHIGTCILAPEAYANAVRRLAGLAFEAGAAGFDIEYFNLGGGLPSGSTLHGAVFPARQTNPGLDVYARAIGETMSRETRRLRRKPRLFLETGRALVDDAGYLLTTVVANKTFPGGNAPAPSAWDPKGLVAPPSGTPVNGVIVDAGVHLLYTGAWYRFDVLPGREIAGPDIPTKLCGCLCMNIDVIREEVPLPPVRPGDPLVIHPVGAYNVSQSMQFIAYRPRVVLIDEQGGDHVIREKESLDYIEEMERLPAYLRCAGVGDARGAGRSSTGNDHE